MSVAPEVEQSFLTVSEAALSHFRNLLSKEDTPGMNLRVYVANPLTSQAEVGVTFCPVEEQNDTDIPFDFGDFTLFVDRVSKEALLGAKIDFKEDKLGGQLSIKAPNLKGNAPSSDSPLQDRVEYVIESEINPNLAGHGGKVNLEEILEGGIVILRFGGGCHGCGMANVTLKQGIEKSLKEKFPEITEVRDITDHSTGENPYY